MAEIKEGATEHVQSLSATEKKKDDVGKEESEVNGTGDSVGVSQVNDKGEGNGDVDLGVSEGEVGVGEEGVGEGEKKDGLGEGHGQGEEVGGGKWG